MTISEDFFSREQHETTEGITVRLTFTCTWDDWSNGTDGTIDLPIIGDKLTDYLTGWPEGYDELICTDRKAITENNDYARVLCFYTTESSVARQRRPGQAKSWKFDLIPDNSIENILGWQQTDGTWTAWERHWTDNKPIGAPDDPLPMFKHRITMTFRITVYSKFWLMPWLIHFLGAINDREFLRPAIDAFVSNDNFITVWGIWDGAKNANIGEEYTGDTRQWLFLDVESERVSKNSFEYKLYFKHAGFNAEDKRLNWDTQNGIGELTLYPTVDFLGLLNDVSNLDDDMSGGG